MNLQLGDFRFRTPAPRRGFCFWTNAHQMRGDSPNANGYCLGMDDLTDEDLFLDAVDAIVFDALARIGDDPKARFQFFRRILTVAQ